LEEEMNQTYGTNRAARGIIINIISELVMRLAKNIMECKLLRKCHKEEVPTGVIASVSQCAKGIVLRWIPYLLNLFTYDCKHA
jgi:hypothetical protein